MRFGDPHSATGVIALWGSTDIPPIWDAFQQTKELASHRHNIRTGMQKWSKQKGLDIDKAPFFTESSIKDIVGQNFNPGEAVTTFSRAQRGISILICRPKTAQEVEKIKDYEDARRETTHTAQFNDVRRRQKTQPSPPPDTYHELRYSINTFCALLWTLFGEECDYYKGMLEIAETLDLQEVRVIHDSFTADICRRITWAILTDGRSFFNTVIVEAQFRRTERFKWPTSLIHKIIDDVRFAQPIFRPNYPTEWIITPSLPPGGGGGAGRGGGGGGGALSLPRRGLRAMRDQRDPLRRSHPSPRPLAFRCRQGVGDQDHAMCVAVRGQIPRP